jgi:hypothetical protein
MAREKFTSIKHSQGKELQGQEHGWGAERKPLWMSYVGLWPSGVERTLDEEPGVLESSSALKKVHPAATPIPCLGFSFFVHKRAD